MAVLRVFFRLFRDCSSTITHDLHLFYFLPVMSSSRFAKYLFSARPALRELRRPCTTWQPRSLSSFLNVKTFSSYPSVTNTARSAPEGNASTLICKLGGIAGFGMGLLVWKQQMVFCDSPATPPAPPPQNPPYPPPPQSILSLYELSFGTVCGICAGVFIKKGLKAVAFALGGLFVMLQYFGSLSFLRVDWSRVISRVENNFYAGGPPTAFSVWTRLVNFLTADFQPRASFLTGLTLGLRLG